MRIFNGFFSLIIAVLVLALVILYPFASAINENLLSDTFYTERLETAGTYDAAYDALMSEVEKQVFSATAEDPNMDEDIANWVVESFKSVLTREYVVDLIGQNMTGTVAYLTDEAEALPTFDLTPKYEELRQVISEGLTLDRVLTISGLSSDGVNETVLIALGVIDEDGNINSVLKEQAMRATFDTNDALKEPFMMTSVVDVLTYAGNDNAREDAETLKKWVTFFHKGVLPMLLVLSFLSTLLILMHLGRIRTAFSLNGWAYTLGGAVTVIVGAVLLQESGWLIQKLQDLMAKSMGGFSGVLSLNLLMKPLGNTIATKGIIFLAIGVVLLLLAGLMRKRARQE